jgi:hypothetical protein
MEYSLPSEQLSSAEIAAHCRLQMVTWGELAARLNIFTLRHPTLGEFLAAENTCPGRCFSHPLLLLVDSEYHSRGQTGP